MRRGELCTVHGLAGDRVVLIMSVDAVNGSDVWPNVQAVPVVDDLAAPNNMLTVPLAARADAYALVDRISAVPKKRIGEAIGRATPDDLDNIESRLAVLFDLHG